MCGHRGFACARRICGNGVAASATPGRGMAAEETMRAKMSTKHRFAPLLVLTAALITGCLPDRMPPKPVEITRPRFKNFDSSDSTRIAVPLRDPVIMHFNEPMDPASFKDNFSLFSASRNVPGTFTAQDSTVIFTPSEDMAAAEIQHVIIRGGVKDANGNSMSIEEGFFISTWFFTEGEYSRGGYGHVYVTDRVADALHLVGDFDRPAGQITDLQRPRGLALTPDGSKLLVVNNIANGLLSVYDAASEQKTSDVAIGRGPNDVATDGAFAYVVNVSAKTISVVDLAALSEVAVIDFPDGFRPRHIALAGDRLLLTSNNLADKGTVKILDKNTRAEVATLSGVLVNQRSARAAATPDGRLVYIPEERSARIAVVDPQAAAVVATTESPVPQNTDVAVDNDFAYVSVNGGWIFKFELGSHSVADSAFVGTNVEGVALVPGGEILYASAPNDTAALIFETSTMTRLGRAPLSTTIQKLIAGAVKF